MTDQELIHTATRLVGEFRTSQDCVAGGVASALVTRGGRVYTGICIDTECGLGFCAEHSAIAEMLKARESEIAAILAVGAAGIYAPCGRCRELIRQVSPSNSATRVILAEDKAVTLEELLPFAKTEGSGRRTLNGHEM